ncbi:putative P-type Ca(2+) transporter [Helianthus debilis subsp. tardiflorus]
MKRMIGDQAIVLILPECETMGSATSTLTVNQMAVTKFLLGLEYMEPHSSNVIAPQVLELLHLGVGFNTMSMLFRHGSPTDKAILSWAIEELDMDMEKLKQGWIVLHAKTFNSENKRSGVSIRRKSDNTIHVHWKGDAEMILPMCLEYYNNNGCKKLLDSDSRKQLENIIEGMAASGLRCIAFGHKNVLEGMDCKKIN